MIAWSLPHFHPFRVKDNKLSPLVFGSAVRHVSINLLGLFSPIYIFQSHSELGVARPHAISLTLLFYVILLIVKMLALMYSEELSQKVGFKGTIWLSVIPFLIFLPLLILAREYQILFLLAAVMWGVHAGLFWWGYHGYFIKAAKSHFGMKIGEIDLFNTVVGFSTPIIGALVTTFFGFDALFFVSGVVMVLSLFILGRKHDAKQKHDVKVVDVLKLVLKKKVTILAYAGRGGEIHIYGIVWPMFLFFMFGRVLDLGAIVSVAALIAGLVAVVVGKLVDERGERWAISLGGPLMAISWLIRFIPSVPLYVVADSTRNISQKLVGVPLMELSYKKALESSTGAAMLFREFGLTIGALLVLYL